MRYDSSAIKPTALDVGVFRKVKKNKKLRSIDGGVTHFSGEVVRLENTCTPIYMQSLTHPGVVYDIEEVEMACERLAPDTDDIKIKEI
jgi:hypothetical protein